MKSFLTVTALLEGFTGLALAIVPAMLISILLGTSLSQPAAILMARLAGAALITIAIGCWLIRNDSQSSAMVQAMLVYNILSVALLVYAAMTENIAGAGLWPVVFIHFVMLVWCVSSLRKRVQIRI